MTYQRGKEQFNEDTPGEGKVFWLDRNNIIFEREWWMVEGIHHSSGRIGIYRWWWDGDQPRKARADLAPAQAMLQNRPYFGETN